MRGILILAVLLLVVGGYAARFADSAVVPQRQASAQQAAGPREPVSSGRSLMVERERDGHFHIDTRVNGRFVPALVDTGASVVVLRETDAANAGIRRGRTFPSPCFCGRRQVPVRHWRTSD